MISGASANDRYPGDPVGSARPANGRNRRILPVPVGAGLIAGHARILAARQLGIAEIPVMVAAGWSEAQKRA
jgi:hypothetical protein